MPIQAGDVIWNVTASLDGLKKGLSSGLKTVEQSAKQMARHAQMIGVAFGAAGAAITGALGLAVKDAISFGTAMAEVNTLGVANLDALKSAVKDVSAEFGLNLVDSAKAAYQAISAGAKEAEAPKLLADAAMAATAGVTDLTTAIELGTSVSNAFGLELSNVSAVYDQAFIAVKNGVTTFEELAQSIGRVSPVMSAAGLSTDEMFAAIAALTKGGIQTTEAVSGLKAALAGIIKPTSEAQLIAEELGIEFNSQALEALGLSGMMEQLSQATGGNVDQMAQLFGSVEALNVVLALTGEQSQSFNATLSEIRSSTDATKTAFEAFTDSDPGYGWRQLWAETRVLVVTLGEALLPVLGRVVDFIKPIVSAISEWVKSNPQIVTGVLVVMGAIGSLMVALAPLLIALPGIVALAGAVAGAFSWVGAAVAGAAVGVGVVLVAAFTVLRNAMRWAVAWVKENWERIKATFKAAMDALRAWWGVLAELFRIGIDIIVIILEGLGLAIVDEYERITGDTKTFQGDFLDIIARLAENLKWAFEIIRADLMVVRVWLEQNWDGMVQGAQWFWTAIVRPIGNFIQLIERAITTWNRLRSIMPDRLISQMLGIPQMFASGGVVQALASGGIVDHRLVMVGERGPELAALPVGSRVMSYADMRAAVADGTRGSANETQVVIDLRGTVIQRDADADALLEKLSGLMTARFSAVGLQYG